MDGMQQQHGKADRHNDGLPMHQPLPHQQHPQHPGGLQQHIPHHAQHHHQQQMQHHQQQITHQQHPQMLMQYQPHDQLDQMQQMQHQHQHHHYPQQQQQQQQMQQQHQQQQQQMQHLSGLMPSIVPVPLPSPNQISSSSSAVQQQQQQQQQPQQQKQQQATAASSQVKTETIREKAKKHMRKNPCTCSKKCYQHFSNNGLDIAVDFRTMKQTERLNVIRAMLLVISKPPPPSANDDDDDENPKKRARVSYMLQGEPICQSVFVGLVQISRATLCKQNTSVTRSKGFKAYAMNRYKNKKGCQSKHTKLIIEFLKDISASRQKEGRGAPAKDKDGNKLPVYLGKKRVYEHYCSSYPALVHTKQAHEQPGPKPVGLSTFLDVWNRYLPRLRVSRGNEMMHSPM